MTTVAIGDIHGMYDMLDRLLVEIDAFSFRERGIVSTAQTNCAGTRRDSVPVGLREKGREALVCFSSAHIAARVAKRGAMCAAPFQLPVSAPPSSDVFGFAFWL